MADTKTIAIIDATSEMGAAITRSLSVSSNLRLLLMSDDHAKLEELKVEVGAHKSANDVFTMTCAREASWEADIIIITMQCSDEKQIADKIRDVTIGKIVISTTNPIIDAYYNPEKSENTSAAERRQKLLPQAKVVKAFNTMFPNDFTLRADNDKAVDVFIAGNSGEAVHTTSEVIERAGFNAIVVGDLAVSSALEHSRLKLIQYKIKEYDWLGIGKYFALKQ